MVYDIEEKQDTWWGRNGGDVIGIVVAAVVAACVIWMISTSSETKAMAAPAPKVFNTERTEELAKAKCGEYNMEWYQYTDAGRVYKNRYSEEELVLYCINRETNVTVREFIPMIFDGE